MPKSKTAKYPKIPLLIAALVLIIAGLLIIKSYKIKTLPQTGPATPQPSVIAQAVFSCDGKKSIEAVFESNQVALKLSDGRNMTVPLDASTSGARYANRDQSLVFSNKGKTSFIEEGQQTTYTNCVIKAQPAPSTGIVSVKGELLCLPHKNQTGAQTMECAYGLKANNGTLYSLNDSDPGYKNISSAPIGKKVEVTGSLELKEDPKYDTIGILTVKSIKQL